jgi:excisionase family DNA binding protein
MYYSLGDLIMDEKLTASELAKKLKVSVAAVRKWTRQGLPCDRLGKRLVRFDQEKVLRWLNDAR